MCEERGAYGSAANLCNKHIGNKRMANKHIANKQIGFSVSANLLIESRNSISILDISFDDGRQKPLAVFSCVVCHVLFFHVLFFHLFVFKFF